MPLLEDDTSHAAHNSKLLENVQFNNDSVMASPPRESREINDYCLQWSHEATLNSGMASDAYRNVPPPTNPQ